ncbi:MAG: TetR/AcrR family transcriptional regulator [Syntrophales bacterium]|nr:TetR/AcrR family transcriptional regulator [Syntrophales bacterium]
MQAAMELIAERGFHGAPMAEIADKASVAAGTIYRYFENKETLINEIYREMEDEIRSALLKDYPVDLPIRERFLFMVGEIIRYFIRNPLHFRYMEQHYNSPYGILMRRNRLMGKPGREDIVMELFEDGVLSLIMKDLPVVVLLSLAFGPIISVMRDHIIGLVTLDEPMIGRISEACWDAIKR